MTGMKMARIRRCHVCEHRYTRHAEINRWPRCDGRTPHMDLDDACLEGPATNCPMDYWSALRPVDLEAEAAARKARGIEREVARWKGMVDALCPGEISREEIRARLSRLVELRAMLPEAAAEIEEYVVNR